MTPQLDLALEEIEETVITDYLDSEEFSEHAASVIEEYNKTAEAQVHHCSAVVALKWRSGAMVALV